MSIESFASLLIFVTYFDLVLTSLVSPSCNYDFFPPGGETPREKVLNFSCKAFILLTTSSSCKTCVLGSYSLAGLVNPESSSNLPRTT